MRGWKGAVIDEAWRVMGGTERLRRVLEDGESVEDVVNTNVDPLYHLKRMGDILTSATATQAGVTVSDAYEVAKAANGKYHGWLKQQRNLPVHLLEKAIRSFEALIADHEAWIEDPTRKNPDFYQLPTVQQKHLLEKYWPDDIRRHRDSIEILKGIIREKQHGNQ